MRKKDGKIKGILGGLLVISIIANMMLISSYGMGKKNEAMLAASMKSIEQEYVELENLTKGKLNELCELYYEKKLKDLLPQEEIEYLARMSWDFTLGINDSEVVSPSYELKGDNVKITFTERLLNSDLPVGIVEDERLIEADADLMELVKVEFDREPAEAAVEEKDGNRVLTYLFTGVKRGEVITVRLNPTLIEIMGLRDRINLKDDKIEIIKTK